MLAIVGLIVPEFVRVPGEIFQNVSVLDAHNVMVRALLFEFRVKTGLGFLSCNPLGTNFVE